MNHEEHFFFTNVAKIPKGKEKRQNYKEISNPWQGIRSRVTIDITENSDSDPLNLGHSTDKVCPKQFKGQRQVFLGNGNEAEVKEQN